MAGASIKIELKEEDRIRIDRLIRVLEKLASAFDDEQTNIRQRVRGLS